MSTPTVTYITSDRLAFGGKTLFGIDDSESVNLETADDNHLITSGAIKQIVDNNKSTSDLKFDYSTSVITQPSPPAPDVMVTDMIYISKDKQMFAPRTDSHYLLSKDGGRTWNNEDEEQHQQYIMRYGLGDESPELNKQIHHLGYNSSYVSSSTIFATIGESNNNTEGSSDRRNIIISYNNGKNWNDYSSTSTSTHHYPIKYVSDDSVATGKPMFAFTIDNATSNEYRQVIRSVSDNKWDIIEKKDIIDDNNSDITTYYQISPGCYFPPLKTVIGVERSTGNLYYYHQYEIDTIKYEYMEQIKGLSSPEQTTLTAISIGYPDGNTPPAQIWEYIEYDETNNLLIGLSPTINKVAIVSNAWTNNGSLCYYIKFVNLPSIPLTPPSLTNSWNYVSADGGRIIISALLSASTCYSIDGGNTWKQLDVSKSVSGNAFFTTKHTVLRYDPVFDSYVFTNTQTSNDNNYYPVAGIISPYQWSDINHTLEEQITRISTQITSINTRLNSLEQQDINMGNRLGDVESGISQLKELMSSLLSVGSVVQFGATGATPSLPSNVVSTGTWSLVNEVNYVHDGTSYNVNSWMKTMESNNSP